MSWGYLPVFDDSVAESIEAAIMLTPAAGIPFCLAQRMVLADIDAALASIPDDDGSEAALKGRRDGDYWREQDLPDVRKRIAALRPEDAEPMTGSMSVPQSDMGYALDEADRRAILEAIARDEARLSLGVLRKTRAPRLAQSVMTGGLGRAAVYAERAAAEGCTSTAQVLRGMAADASPVEALG